MSETPIERAAEALIPYSGAATNRPMQARHVFESIDETDVSRVLRDHRIECTGLGEVSCRCREGGWMTFGAFARHQAEAVKAHLLSERTEA